MSNLFQAQQLYVQVYVISGFAKPLTYAVPFEFADEIQVGSLVRVNLRGRSELGIVAKVGDVTLADGFDVRKIKSVEELMYDVPLMNGQLIDLYLWMQRYYAASAESVLETMIPAPIRKKMRLLEETYLKLAIEISEEEFVKLKKRSPKQGELYEFLKVQSREVLKREALSTLNMTDAVSAGLVKKGIVTEEKKAVERVAYQDNLGKDEAQLVQREIVLNDEQQAAFESLDTSLKKNEFQVHLLHGVTGSGKTEVYVKAIESAINAGGGVLFLVPEVALTPQTVGRLQSRLAHLNIKTVVWHSMLSDGERFDAWLSIARGETKIVVGARSAVFAPIQNLKLVIVDEEHEPAFKQEESPRYHGRDVAVYRAMLANAVCVLGSATPSLESLYNLQIKKYQLNRLNKRIDDRQLPKMHIVDMKKEIMAQTSKLRHVGPVTFSRVMLDKIRDRLENKEQTILFLNRRGFSSSMLCPACGYVAECDHCSVTLTYHRSNEQLRCHICDASRRAPMKCPQCSSLEIRWRGFGTQRIEEQLAKIFPHAKVMRMDADTMSKKHLFREILSDFRKGKIDILLGTQMIAKGLDFPNVTLVGLIDADISLHMPDFRASERTFQLLVQVSGRAGRGDRAGEVVVQTFTPESAPIQFARKTDFDGFLEAELQTRKEYHYPPYRHLVRHIFRSLNEEKVSKTIHAWADFLESKKLEGIELRGPSPAPLAKERGYYRYQLWYFIGNVSKWVPHIVELREAFPMDKDVIDVLDVDPVDMS
jgi:primosomal protein N' (replication factor Y)